MFLFPTVLSATMVIGITGSGMAPNNFQMVNDNNKNAYVYNQECTRQFEGMFDKLQSQGVIIGGLKDCFPGNGTPTTCPEQGQPGYFPGVELPNIPPEVDQPEENLPEVELPEENESTDSSYAAEVLRLVNEERAKAGVAPLTADTAVESAANVRAREIEISFSHTRPDGSSFSSALEDLGVSFRGAGENIAWGQKTPQEVVAAWMNSEGHRANILNPEYKIIGIGHNQVTSGTSYWVQLFTY